MPVPLLTSIKKTAPWRRPPLMRLSWHAGLFLILLFVGTYLLPSPQVAFLERQLGAMQMSIYRRCYSAQVAAACKRIVLVPINDETFVNQPFKALGTSPLPRSFHAKIIRELQKAGAAVIVFDLLFDKVSPDDLALAEAVKASHIKVVWGVFWQPDDSEDGRWILPNEALRRASPLVGHTRTPHTQIDLTADRLEAIIDSPQGRFSALGVQAAQAAESKNSVRQGQIDPLGIDWKHIAPGTDGTFKIVFTGEPGMTFPTVPYEEAYKGIKENSLLGDIFKEKIVIIGDETEIQKDFLGTPIGRMAGMEIHASATATLLQKFYLSDAGPQANVLVLMIMLVLGWLLGACLSLRRVLPGALLLLCGYLVVSTWLFVSRGWDFAFVVPAAAMLLMVSGVLAERGGTEEGARQRMSGVLDQYVSPQVSHHGAPTGELTLVFTDIEGSSQLSERHGALFEKAREDHFLLLREATRRWNGFEVESAGDSLFIVFAEAADAVRFAVDGQLALTRHDWPMMVADSSGMHGAPAVPGASGHVLPVRIGMHTGTPFIGRDHTRFTYRGPATNRAARVMGAGHGGQILLSQVTWNRARAVLEKDPEFAGLYAIERGAYRLKGLGQDVLWEVCHPQLFEPPPRPLRDDLLEDLSS